MIKLNLFRALKHLSIFVVVFIMVIATVENLTLVNAYLNHFSGTSTSINGSSASSVQFSTVPTCIPGILNKARLIGPVSPDAQLSLQLILPLTSSSRLQSLVNEVYDPSSSLYHHFLTPSQFNAPNDPQTSEVAVLTAYLQSNGLEVHICAVNSNLILVNGTVRQVQQALKTQIDSYSWNGRVFYSAASQAQLPKQFSNVQMIYGLENFDFQVASSTEAVPLYLTLGKVTPGQTPSTGALYYSPSEVTQMYNATALYSAGYTGTGFSIAIVDAYGDPYIQQELENFSAQFGLPLSNGTLHIIPIGPYNPANGITTGWNVEVALDVEWAHAMAPNATINLYVASNSGSALFNAVLNATLGFNGTAYGACHNNVISMSWGTPENDLSYSTGTDCQWLDQVFQTDAALGITVFASSGDWGAYDQAFGQTSPYGGATWPSTDPYVTSVGGTSLYMNATSGYYQWPYANATGMYGSESAWSWNNYYDWGTGGGWSTVFGQPSWQTGPGVVNNGERGNPDVAWDADPQTGVLVSVFNSTTGLYDYYDVGGTSVGAPSWAGAMALLDQKAGRSLGLISPKIYSILSNGTEYSEAFHDVTVGNNNPYSATKGWDPLTGVGSPNLGELAGLLTPANQVSVLVTNDFSNVSNLGRAYAYGQIVNLTAVVANNRAISGPVTANITSSTGTTVASNMALTYNASTGAWLGSYMIKPTDPSGEWSATVTAMNASSLGEGYTTFAVGDQVTFVNPPFYSGQFFQMGDYIRVYTHVIDSRGKYVITGTYAATFYLAQNQNTVNGLGKVEGTITLQYSLSDRQWEASFTIPKNADQGAWIVVVNGTDLNGNKGTAYTWINLGLIVSPFTDSPTYILGDTISIFAYPEYKNGSEAETGKFTAMIYCGSTFLANVPLAFTNETGLGQYYDIIGLWKGEFKPSAGSPVGFYTIVVNGTDEKGNSGSFATIIRVAQYRLSVQASLSNPIVPVQNGNESWVLAIVKYPGGSPVTTANVIGFLYANASGDLNSSLIESFPMTYNTALGGFVSVNVFHAVNATETLIANYTVDVEAYDALGNYGNSSASFYVAGTLSSFTTLTVTVVQVSTLRAISGAAVQAVGLQTYSAETNSTGIIVFGKVQVGDYQVSASAQGYFPSVNIPIVVTNSSRLTIELQQISVKFDWWSMFHHDMSHVGYSTSTGPQTNKTLWVYNTQVGIGFSSPAIANGFVYVGSYDWNVYALNMATGTVAWKFLTGNYIESSPAVANGVVYVGSMDGKVYALNATTGALIWKFTTGSAVFSSPAVSNGIVYVGSEDHNIYALNTKTGALVWRYATGNLVDSSPAVANGVVYVGSWDHNVYALDAGTGRLWWTYTTGGAVESSPAVANGVVYVGSYDDNVYALSATTGYLIWSYTTGFSVMSSPAVSTDVVYVGSGDSYIYALNATTGGRIWKYGVSGGVGSSPAVADGVVYVGEGTAKVFALNAKTGALVWAYATGGPVFSSPAVADGVVFVGSSDGKIYAFGSLSPAYSVSFSESGMPQEARWSVTFAGQTQGSTSNLIMFGAFNGIYPFSITSPVGYKASLSSGNVTVNGADVVEKIVFTGSPVYDVAITNVKPSKTIIGRNYSAEIEVTAANLGTFTETFNVTAYADPLPSNFMDTQEVTLQTENSTTLTFYWPTPFLAYGNYTIWAYASPVPHEINVTNNKFVYGKVLVTIPGDVGGYHVVNILDVVMITSIYGMKQGNPKFNPNCDIDSDGIISIEDVVICTSHYGQHW